MKKYVLAVAIALAATLGGAAKGSNNTEVAKNLNIFNTLFKELYINYVDSLDANQAVRDAIDAMLMMVDPYTEYYSASEQEEYMSMSSGEFGGIGCNIVQRDGRVMMSKPTWGSPSRLAGVRHGDYIVAIDGDTVPKGYTSDEAVKRLRGKAGTKLLLTVERPYADDSIIDIEITRGTIRTNPVPFASMLSGGVGYIDLTTFNEHSADGVRKALNDFKKDPALQGLVLDLRGNGGGLIDQAVQITGMFVPKGTVVVETKYRDPAQNKTYKTTQQPIAPNVPLVVLVDGGTASAAEIVSGSLQDLDRAVIMGDRTYGKGLVQSSRPLPFSGLLKLTVARYYIPSGRLIQAIDWSHRNPDGTVARIPDSLTNVFHTAAGREVRDGGGITPDVKIEPKQTNRLIYNTISGFWNYDYATRFAARQGADMPADDSLFVITDSIFADFKAFVDPERFSYDRACEEGIKYLRTAAETEGYMSDSVAAQLDALEALLRHDLDHDLDFNRRDLELLLDQEIADRYYDEATVIRRALRWDTTLDAARELLADHEKYNAILRPKE